MRIANLDSKISCLLLVFVGWSTPVLAQPKLLCTPAAVQGRVLDAQGQPIAGAELFVQRQPYSQDVEWSATQPEEADLLGTATSDVTGYFKIDWEVTEVSALKNTSVRASLIVQAPGYELGFEHFTMWRSQHIEFKLKSESEHVGQVVDDQGQPLANAEVLVDAIHLSMKSVHRGMIFSSDGLLSLMHSTLRPRTRTDSQGNYSLKGLPKGQVVLLQVTHAKYPAIRRFQPIDENSPQQIEPGQANNRFSEWRASYGVPMAMSSAPMRNVVAVDRTTGEIVPGVKVCRFFDGQDVEADASGRLSMWLNQEEAHNVSYYACRNGEKPWSQAFYVEVEDGIDHLQIASPKTLFGQVADAKTGQGIEGVAVYVDRPGSPRFSLAYTDESGKYSMTTYERFVTVTLAGPCMKYQLPVEPLSNIPKESSAALDPELHTRRVEFSDGRDSAELDFSLPRYPVVYVKVIGFNALPANGVNVHMVSLYDNFSRKSTATSDQDGLAELNLDRPLTESYIWVAGEDGFAVEELSGIPDEVAVLELVPTIRIRGNVSLVGQGDGVEAVAGLPVFVRFADKQAGLELATTDEAGDFSLYLPPVDGEHVVLYVEFYSEQHVLKVGLVQDARANFVLESK